MKNSSLKFSLSFGLVFLIFAIIYGITSIYPHINFRTAALDLGMLNHALYSYAHFKPDTFTLAITGSEIPFLGDHFSPIVILYSPLYFLLGEYTLLIIQILAILLGGYGIFKYSLFKGLDHWMSLLLTIHFFTLFGIFSALNFDFHNNVIAAMLVPWFIYFYDKGQFKWMFLFYLLILITKENMALWMVFILLALILRKEGNAAAISKKMSALLMILSVIYFIITVEIIMPAFLKGNGINQLDRYAHVGNSFGEILIKLWRKPDIFFTMLFENTIGLQEGTGVKSQLHFLILVSGGFAFFRKPHFLVMLIPIYAQKMFSNSLTFWSFRSQYSIEFVPVISLAVISLICYYRKTNWSWAIIALVIFNSVHFNEKNLSFLKKDHYISDIDVTKVNELLKLIPNDAKISVNSMLAPHLAFREKIYHYPVIKDAGYIALIKKRSYYPLTRDDFNQRAEVLRNHPEADIVAENEDIIIAKIKTGFNTEKDYSKLDPEYYKRISAIKRNIYQNKEWFNSIIEKAAKRRISLDSMVNLDAHNVYKDKYSTD